MSQKIEDLRTFARWRSSPNIEMVPIILALEKDRRPTLCGVFPAESETDPVFWRATPQRNTANTIRANIEWMFSTATFLIRPKPVAILAGIPADVYFAALSGRLIGDDPKDASGETGEIFRLALTLLPDGTPIDDMLSVVRRFGRRVWPFLGMGVIPQSAKGDDQWLPLPDNLWEAFEFENKGDYGRLLNALISQPGGHSAYRRSPALATISTEECGEANR